MRFLCFLFLFFLIGGVVVKAQEKVEYTKEKLSHRKYYSEIIINAKPSEVWSVLTDFKSYTEWSYLFKKMEGDFHDRQEVTTYFEAKPGKSDKLKAYRHIINIEKGKSFSWSDKFAMGMTDNHIFLVEAYGDNQTKFIQSDEVKGGMTWLFGGVVSKYHIKHYPLYNKALKKEVERRFNN